MSRASEPVKVRAVYKVTWLTQDCPCCNADWRGAEIDDCERDAWGGLSHYSTVYWRRGAPETIIIFECPKCGVEFVTNEGCREDVDHRVGLEVYEPARTKGRRRVGPPLRHPEPRTFTPAELGVDLRPSQKTLDKIDQIEREAAETMRAIKLDPTVFR